MQYSFQIIHTVVLYYFNAHMNISGGSDNDILHRESIPGNHNYFLTISAHTVTIQVIHL